MIILYTFAINISKILRLDIKIYRFFCSALNFSYLCTVKRFFLLFLAFYTLSSVAQTPDWQEDMQEWNTAEDMVDVTNMELLEDLSTNKLNLNQVTREQLEQLPFLSAQQVEAIMEYLYRYGPMRSLSELQMITQLDYQTRQQLTHYVMVGKERPHSVWPKMSDITKYGKHTLMATAKIPFYDRHGDLNGYLGYKYRHDFRYQFNYDNRIKLGITAAQDAGEPFFSNRNTLGYDHYSYYFQLRDIGRLEALNLGMYRVQLGMGLIMNTGYRLGKLATLQNLGRSTHSLTAHTSRAVAGYLQGAAATLRLSDQLKVTAFASYRPLDATLNDDGTARTLVTNGYHRSLSEMNKKHNTHETDLGISMGWRKSTLFVNANAVYSHMDRRLAPQKENIPYRRYAAEGSDFANFSLDYGYNNAHMSFSGETAVNRNGAIATLHSLSYIVNPQLRLTTIHRYFDKRYTALHAHSFSEGGSVQNEHGIYLGVNWQPAKPWLIQGYVDYAHFSWHRFRVSGPSDTFDAMFTTKYSQEKWSLEGRYRMHLRQQDNSDKTRLTNRPEHQLRMIWSFSPMSKLTLRTQGNAASRGIEKGNSQGVMLNQEATWKDRWLQVNANIGWFRTDDSDSRIYLYEKSVLYDNATSMYYGHGIRYTLMARAEIDKRFTLSAKMGVTNYFDRSTISSGLQQVDASSMADLLLQLRVQL